MFGALFIIILYFYEYNMTGLNFKNTNFKRLSPKSVKRFYHLDYYYFLLSVITNKPVHESSILNSIKNQIQKFNEIAYSLISVKKFGTKYSIRSVLEESVYFGLVNYDSRRYSITGEGLNLLEAFENRQIKLAERIIGEKMEILYGGISQLVESLYRANLQDGLIVFPKPSPKDLGLNSKRLLHEKYLKEYVKAFAEYTYDNILKYVGKEIFPSEIEKTLFSNLVFFLTKAKENNVINVNLPREVKNIMYDFYLKTILDNKFDRVSFEIWLLRCKELRIVNSSEFFPNTFSRVIYPTSRLSTFVPSSFEFFANAKSLNKIIVRFCPKWSNFKEVFMQALWEIYQELTSMSKSFYVSVLDLRDVICFKLQISEKDFEEFLGTAFNESIEGRMDWDISLEVDRLPEERVFVKSKRFPILINNIPKNIIAIKIK